MKKFGFTLAEVLITLGIVGVIAAITLPTLITDTSSAQIGPKLAKAVSVFEQANEVMLNDSSVDSISDMLNIVSGEDRTETVINTEYWTAISDYLKGSLYTDGYLTKDGTALAIFNWITPEDSAAPSHKQRIADFFVDINGDSAPNTASVDRFQFAMYNDGSVRPWGGTNYGEANDATQQPNGDDHWTTQCPINAIPEDPLYCAGHIFENNLKVLYK